MKPSRRFSPWSSRHLLWALVRRDLAGRYKGSVFGLLWSVAEPVALLGIYTLVFGGLFRLRLGEDGSLTAYSLYIFSGIIVWLAISEGINRSTTIIPEHSGMVKKVIFPVEILPLQVVLSALVQQLIGLFVLAAGLLLQSGGLHWTWLLLPLLLLPQFLLTAGIGWLLAGSAVFFRDLRPAVALGLVCWMFLTPIFYPEEMVRQAFGGRVAWWLVLNPAAALLHNYRRLLLFGQVPQWGGLLYLYGLGIGVCRLGWWWFGAVRRAMVDNL